MGEVLAVNGPIVIVRLPNVVIGEQVRVGRLGLVGEVIGRSEDCATVQVYEMTDGLRPGEQTEALGHPLSVELGPGLLGGIFDGVQRSLTVIQALEGDRIARGLQIPLWTATANGLSRPAPSHGRVIGRRTSSFRRARGRHSRHRLPNAIEVYCEP